MRANLPVRAMDDAPVARAGAGVTPCIPRGYRSCIGAQNTSVLYASVTRPSS